MSEKNKTIELILSAATDIFSEVGFAGARVDEIAKRAGVNKATIYYNIGNKKTLYSRVLQSIFDDPVEQLAEEIKNCNTPEEKLRFYIQMVAQRIDRNPNIPNLIMWEHASGGKNFPEDFGAEVVRMIGVLTSILEEGEKQGLFERLDPLLIHIMITGSFMFYKTSIPIRNKFLAFPESLKTSHEELSGRVAEEIGNYITKVAKK